MAYQPVNEDPVVHTPGHVHEPEHVHSADPAHAGGHLHEPVAPAPVTPVPDHASGLTAYAAVKYGAMVIITLVILYFLARFVIPLFT